MRIPASTSFVRQMHLTPRPLSRRTGLAGKERKKRTALQSQYLVEPQRQRMATSSCVTIAFCLCGLPFCVIVILLLLVIPSYKRPCVFHQIVAGLLAKPTTGYRCRGKAIMKSCVKFPRRIRRLSLAVAGTASLSRPLSAVRTQRGCRLS